jgi:hypothetical protein
VSYSNEDAPVAGDAAPEDGDSNDENNNENN